MSAGFCAVALVVVAGQPAVGSEATAPPEGTSASVVERAGEGSTASAANSAEARRFWVKDRHFYTSKWYAGKHRKMINFGCTKAPYYPPSDLCPRRQGFHHGVDIAMRCGNKLFAGLRGTVVRPKSAGALGPAYGPYAFRLRNQRLDLDFVIGHVLHVYVHPGDHVAKGTLIARASDQAAPDGCHLHFEVRPKRASYQDAIRPYRYLDLRRASS